MSTRNPKGAREHEEIIDGEMCKVIVAKKSGSTWLAYGNFRGELVSKEGNSESAALSRWRRSANYNANK